MEKRLLTTGFEIQEEISQITSASHKKRVNGNKRQSDRTTFMRSLHRYMEENPSSRQVDF